MDQASGLHGLNTNGARLNWVRIINKTQSELPIVIGSHCEPRVSLPMSVVGGGGAGAVGESHCRTKIRFPN